MKLRAIFVWFVTPIVAGGAVLWAGVTLMGYTAAFIAEHRMFGLPPSLVMFLEDIVVWVSLSLLMGLAIGFAVQHKSVHVAFVSSVASMLIFVILGFVSTDLTFVESIRIASSLFSAPALYIMIALPLGAYLYTKAWRHSGE